MLSMLISLMTSVAVILGVALITALALTVALWRHKKAASGELNLVSALALVEITLEPEGAVLVHGELWRARSHNGATVERGARVRVIGANGYWLEVEPLQ